MQTRVTIFDLDGTLIDPSRAICRSVNYALEKKGHSAVDDQRIYPYIGRHLLDPFRDITGITDEKYLWELIHLYRERYEVTGIAENSLYPGIMELLKSLKTQNYIASVKPHHASKKIAKELKIEGFFKGIYGSEPDGERCDKTELLHYIKDREEITEAVMVGDRNVDIIAAKSCGFASVGVTYGYGSRAEIEAAGPNAIAESPKELAGFLLSDRCRGQASQGSHDYE